MRLATFFQQKCVDHVWEWKCEIHVVEWPFLGNKEHFCGEISLFGDEWSPLRALSACGLPSKKYRQGSDPPHPGNAWILGTNGPAIHPLGMVSRTNSYNSQGSLPIKSGGGHFQSKTNCWNFRIFWKICKIFATLLSKIRLPSVWQRPYFIQFVFVLTPPLSLK